jgi:hypothetical protein
LFTTPDEMELTRRYVRLIRRADEPPDEAEPDFPADAGLDPDRTPSALIRRLMEKAAVSPARGTPGEYLYRDIGLWAGFCLLVGLAIFGLHLLGILARETALGMVVTLLLYAIGGAILFFLNQSGDWPQY